MHCVPNGDLGLGRHRTLKPNIKINFQYVFDGLEIWLSPRNWPLLYAGYSGLYGFIGRQGFWGSRGWLTFLIFVEWFLLGNCTWNGVVYLGWEIGWLPLIVLCIQLLMSLYGRPIDLLLCELPFWLCLCPRSVSSLQLRPCNGAIA